MTALVDHRFCAPTDIDQARRVPKALLHDHLDGGLRPTTVLELAETIGWRLPENEPEALQAWFTRGAETRDLLAYLATFEHTLAVMQSAANLERVAAEAVEDLADDGVVYAEIRFAPELHQAEGLALEEVVEAVAAGVRRGESAAEARGRRIVTNLILCAMRTETRSVEIARLVARMRAVEPKVVAFDLAGAETGWPPSLHAEALAIARAEHLNITIHASEPPDLELISDALTHGAHRIGHGVRLAADTRPRADGSLELGPLARHVLDRRIHLELAPTCNVQIGAVPEVSAHPIGPFLRAGFNVGINTDNRLMSRVMPSSELLAVTAAFDLTTEEVVRLVTNAIESSFAPYETRTELLDYVARTPTD